MTSVAASSPSSSPSPPSSSSSSIVVLHVDTSDMRPILKEAFGKNVEIANISNNGSIPAKYLYEGLQNYTEGIVAYHGGGGDDDEDAQRTADGVTAIKKNIGIILKEILNDNLRTALTPFDRDGDGTIDAEELQQAAKDHQTVLMSRKILAWFSFALFLFMIIVCGGLSVGIYYIVFSMKDTYVNPSTGLMMVKAPDGSTDSNTAGIFELPTRTLGQGVTITSQGTMDGRTCYSSDSVANMFVNVATGVTTSLAETNQDTDELHIYHLGNSDCDESNIVWSNKDVQLGCVVMVPSLECTNMVRRGRYLSEFADTDTDAMQDRHRSLKEHVNAIVGATAGGQHGTTIARNNRNLQDGEIYYTYALPTGTCTDSEEVLYKFKKWPAQTCAKISTMTTEKMKVTCKKNTKPNRGKVYDLCQKTCATVDLGPCKGSFVEAAPDCTTVTAEKDDLEAEPSQWLGFCNYDCITAYLLSRLDGPYKLVMTNDRWLSRQPYIFDQCCCDFQSVRTDGTNGGCKIDSLLPLSAEQVAPFTPWGSLPEDIGGEDIIDDCVSDCASAYSAAGADGVGGVPGSGRSECNDDEFAAYPNYCEYRACNDDCSTQA